MTIWQPNLRSDLPRYAALAQAIADDLEAGRLKPGDQLPTHRDLADFLGVTIGTVSRGYAEAEKRGLTIGEVGRGTFIKRRSGLDSWPSNTEHATSIDLSLSLPVSIPEEREAFRRTLTDIAKSQSAQHLLSYHPETAYIEQKTIFSKWLQRLQLQVKADDVLVTAGSQHSLNVVLCSVFKAGDVILTSALTYPSIKNQARHFGLRLRGVPLDEGGICPEALEKACRTDPKPRAVYLVPTLQNPTSAIMSQQRRLAVVEIATTHNLWIIEDDVHSFLLPNPPQPIAAIGERRTIYLSSVAKCLAPGLRTGLILAPPELKSRLLAGIQTSMWMPPPLMVEVTTRWLQNGIFESLIAKKRAETERRQHLVSSFLADYTMARHPFGYQVWLELPEPWSIDEFVTQCQNQGISLVGAGAFAVNRFQLPQAVRICIGTPSFPALERGLRLVRDILEVHHRPAF